MTMQKELIIITSHCNTTKKKEILLKLLISLQSYRVNFDILVSSHVPLDSHFFEYFDFYFFDKNNNVLTGSKFVQNSWFAPFDNYVIWSSYSDYGNTILAIWDMIIPSISIAKSHGYQKAHYIEYDSVINNDVELFNNSELLENFDYIFYNSLESHSLVGAFFSFRLDSIIEEWKKIDHIKMKRLIEESYPKTPEFMFYKMVTNQRNVLRKDLTLLDQNGIIINLSRGSKFYWDVPYFDPNSFRLKFISYNINSEHYDIKIIVNKTQYYYIEELPEHNWTIIDISENFYDVYNLVVFRNNEEIINLDLSSDESKKFFIKYNSVLGNESIDPSIQI